MSMNKNADHIRKYKRESREKWLEFRKNYIGGSDAAAVVGASPFSSPYQLWAEKTEKVEPFKGNLATETGTYLEPYVAQKFAKVTGKKLRVLNYSMVNEKYPYAIADIDRAVVGENAGLEIKTTSDFSTKKFRGGEYPPTYYVQCVHYMAVTGWKKWYLAVLIGNSDFKIFEIERDEEEIAALMAAEEYFYKCMKEDTPPAVDGADPTTEAISEIYSESSDDGLIMDMTGYETALQDYLNCKALIDDTKKSMEEIANRLKVEMKEVSSGLSENFKVSWKTQTKHNFDKEAFSKEHPEIDLSKYMKPSNSRPFIVKKINKEK